jgi:NHLM bacteriocin system ABC transporter ATP-binding protein
MAQSDGPAALSGALYGLRVVASDDAASVGWEQAVQSTAEIGRDRGCFYVVAEHTVSRRHAKVEPGAAGLTVTDLKSSNGVWVGNTRVPETLVRAGERFRIGSTVFECVRMQPAASDDAPAETVVIHLPTPSAAPPEICLRVVQAGTRLAVGQEFKVEARTGAVIVGRAHDCDIVLDEPEISRRHVKIERSPTGFLVTDLGSLGGVYVGSKQVASADLAPGGRIRLGPSLTLELAPDAAASHAPATPAVVVASPPAAPPEKPAREASAQPAAQPAAPSAARPAAPPPVVPAPAASLPPAAPAPPAAPPASHTPAPHVVAGDAGEEAFSHTVSMPIPADILAMLHGLENEGEELVGEAHKPFLAADPSLAYYVVSGGILLFTVAVDKGQPVGPRRHFLAILPGQLFFGMDIARYGFGSGFLAVSKPGTMLRRIPLTRVQELVSSRRRGIVQMIDCWVGGLSKTLAAGLETKRTDEIALTPGTPVELAGTSKATASAGVVWVTVWRGSVLFDDMATPQFAHRFVPFPLTPDSWIQPLGDEFGPLSLTPMETSEAVKAPGFWNGLDAFHQILCECEFVNKRLAAVDEYVRLEQKASRSEAAEAAAYDAIGSVLSAEARRPEGFLEAADGEPILQAFMAVSAPLGIEVRRYPGNTENFTHEEMIAATASASGVKTRVVVLRGDWWVHDNGPLIGQWAESKSPVAILPTSPTAYAYADPVTGEGGRVTEQVAARLSDFAHALYRPFPARPLTGRELVRFGMLGLKADYRLLIVLGIIVGLFGTVAPYLTGQLFDQAIPQADRGLLLSFGLALALAGTASALFKFVQGVATVRVQGRMESSIQAAVWQRMLDLPAGFFRKYEAGDLADRAGGVDQIQQLVSGAGVAAILGSFSGLFYVFQMFTYDLTLALSAVGLTIVFVSVNMLANYSQLRLQRSEYALRGRITGLVLNLISGVSKLRIAGAEPHAFRIWAEQFSAQRRISFKVGNIQNAAMTFTMSFPLICSLSVFAVMAGSLSKATKGGGPPMTTGDFIAFNSAFGLFMMAMQSLGDAALNLLRVVPIFERMKPILEEQPEIDSSKTFPGKLKGDIELSHVNFRYDPDGPLIVKDFSLKIRAGEFVAFVGGSGCGKSTLMRLMLGFERAASGSIYYDGQDLESLDLRMLRQQIGVVLQASRVMPAEIYRNIVGASSRTIDEAWDAAERSGLAEDVRNMPMGMHTYVSEGGGTLSGGQRQRLMIARAIVNKPKVLFLDEATSALDNRTQAIVTESMNKMDATRIVIAHRLSTIINADRICFLEGGQILEMGTYQELMALNGKFAELAKRQVA